MTTFHCLFEQSGTFKNEFKKLGYAAIDYDIQNEFNETDIVIDLFKEINFAYEDKESIFSKFSCNDMVLAFFPCVRFEDQIQLAFRGTNYSMRNWSLEKKLEYDLRLHRELAELYELITKLVLVCIRKNLQLIIENPYSTTHYLTKYWPIVPRIIDMDRTTRGDYFKKPTQYWFINCEPKYNMILEAEVINERKRISQTSSKTERSLLSAEYANRFIKEFIIER